MCNLYFTEVLLLLGLLLFILLSLGKRCKDKYYFTIYQISNGKLFMMFQICLIRPFSCIFIRFLLLLSKFSGREDCFLLHLPVALLK